MGFGIETVAMHTVVFQLGNLDPATGAARRPLPESSPRQDYDRYRSRPIVLMAIVLPGELAA